MLSLSTLVTHSLIYGLILSALMTALILATLYWRPMIWIGDAPKDVQAAVGPMSEDDRSFKKIAGLVVFALLIGLFTISTINLARLAGDSLSFTAVALSTFIIYMVFNLVDLVLIDWLLIVTLRPSFAMIPGTENLASYGDYGFHFRAFLRGTVGGVVLSLVVAAIAVGLSRLVM